MGMFYSISMPAPAALGRRLLGFQRQPAADAINLSQEEASKGSKQHTLKPQNLEAVPLGTAQASESGLVGLQ